jgi:lysophospholipase L1-like esterase
MLVGSLSRCGIAVAIGLVFSGVLLLGGSGRAEVIDPSDPNILYTGRWDDSTASEPWAQAQGSSVIANFQGTGISVTMNTVPGERFRIIVDGDAAGSTKVAIVSGTPRILASSLPDGVHRVEIVKETDSGRATLIGFELDTGKSLAAPPARPARKIVFYGDSNLAGYSLESERNLGSNQRIGSYYTYAGVTARMFDAEYHNISLSGATIGSLNASYDRIDWRSRNPKWNFSLFPADLVVVNIGANDVGRPKDNIKSGYHDLLDDLRGAHPSAHIMLYNAYGWDFDEPANYIHEVIAERGDSNMSSAVFPWLFEQFHGCETDHAGMAQYLAEHLSDVMGWTPGPMDVVSGYGANGDVANGSFEERAPFGGWGWRYFDDAGVSRVHDPVGAHHGEYYLRLSDGAASHQSNPASDGEDVPVTVWMRGENAGDQVDITIDFRNQGQGAGPATPMQAETETLTLTTEWQQYSMTSTAPMDAPYPVFSNRVTFQAAAGDAVYIDRVMSFVPEPGQLLQLLCGVGTLLGLRRLRGSHGARL